MRRAPPGFTLIEVTAVLLLVAVLAGAAAVTLAGPRRRAVASEALDDVRSADAQVRRAALATDQPQTLSVDLAGGRIGRASLPAGVRIARVLLGDQPVDFGRTQVAISAAGRSPSYAVGLTTPDGPRWLLFAGLTGEAAELHDELAVEALINLR